MKNKTKEITLVVVSLLGWLGLVLVAWHRFGDRLLRTLDTTCDVDKALWVVSLLACFGAALAIYWAGYTVWIYRQYLKKQDHEVMHDYKHMEEQ